MKYQEYKEYMNTISRVKEVPVESPEPSVDDFEDYYDIDDFSEPSYDDYYNVDDLSELSDDDYSNSHETPEQATEAFNKSRFVFADGVSRSLNDFETGLNNNICIIGGSGTGKTTSFVEPNLFDPVGSFFIGESKGTLLNMNFKKLSEEGYKVYVVDFQNPENGCRWNPLKNIQSTQDIVRIAHTIVYDPRMVYHADPFWDNANLMFVCALIGYMVETNYKPFNFHSLMQLLHEGERFQRKIEVNGLRQTDDKASKLKERFEALYRKNPNSWAYEQFKSVDSAPGRTYDSICVTLAAKFSNYTSQELETMMSSNDIDFDKIAQEKSAVFVIQSDSDRSMDGLVNLFFTQAMYSLIRYADSRENQRLPIPVRFFLDDYGATTAIDNLETIISTIRSRAISVSLILQSEAQLKNSSKPGADKTILANCDTYIYMGGNDIETAKAVSQRCNKPLEQVLYMPVGHCWVFERGKKPVFSKIAERLDLTTIEKRYDEYFNSDI